MKNKFAALAATVAVASILTGSAFADNTQTQTTGGADSDNISAFSNNDFASWNTADAGNDKSVDSHNDFSINDSGNISVPITDSFNDNSQSYTDSHDNLSDNQTATGQINLNDSYAEGVNAANNGSTIFDGDVLIESLGLVDSVESGISGTNINTGAISNSVQGYDSAQFASTGVGLNNTTATTSTLGSSQVSNANLLNP